MNVNRHSQARFSPQWSAAIRRSLGSCLIGVAALLAGWQSPAGILSPHGSTWQLTPDLTVEQLYADVWRHTSWHVLADGTRFPANGLLVRDADGSLLLIDTPWGDSVTATLLDWVPQHLGARVTRAVVTHAHDDRLGGARALVRRHVAFFAHPLTRQLAAAQGLPLPDTLQGVATGRPVKLGTIEAYFPGAGHAPDNLVVWVPRVRLLFGGCAVKSAAATDLGNLTDANVALWPQAIRRMQHQYPQARRVVPGHGAIGGPALLTHTLALLDQSR